MNTVQQQGAIGVFDSGYGGLTILKDIVKTLPTYSYKYLGDNARTPYGTRSFETVHQYTWQAVQWFFQQGCHLVVLACNTASAKALRTIQQTNLPVLQDKHKRVLGVIRPTAEIIGNYTQTNHIGILGTTGTVQSSSYVLEIEKFFPSVKVHQQACPLFVPLIENNEHNSQGANFFVEKYLQELLNQSNNIDTILLACTHYPLLINKIKNYINGNTKIISQGEIVANSLKDYLLRHPEINALCKQENKVEFFTTDNTTAFNNQATTFWGQAISSIQIEL